MRSDTSSSEARSRRAERFPSNPWRSTSFTTHARGRCRTVGKVVSLILLASSPRSTSGPNHLELRGTLALSPDPVALSTRARTRRVGGVVGRRRCETCRLALFLVGSGSFRYVAMRAWRAATRRASAARRYNSVAVPTAAATKAAAALVALLFMAILLAAPAGGRSFVTGRQARWLCHFAVCGGARRRLVASEK